MTDISTFEGELKDRLKSAATQDESDKIANLIMLSEIKNLLKKDKYKG